jgi:hypothetical protein
MNIFSVTFIYIYKILLTCIYICFYVGNKLSYNERKEFNKLEKEIAKMGGQISEYEDKLATGIYGYIYLTYILGF